jgi:HlyD family secretion protein
MDIQRDPAIVRRRKIRRIVAAALGAAVVVAISVAVSRLEPAAPGVPSGSIWPGTVKRGAFVREVRGAGTLVPEDIRWITATASGRVERIVLRPGAQVEPGTVILELSNPDLVQQAESAKLDWEVAAAQLENQRAQIQTQRLQQEIAVSNAEADYDVALKDLEANRELHAEGLVSALTLQQRQAAVDRAKNALELARRQLAMGVATEQSQLAPTAASVNQARARFEQLSRQVAELQVRSTMTGQLQLIQAEVGATVGSGTNLARVSDPARLKAVVRIAETQTRDLAIGLPAFIDTRIGQPVRGRVSRIDPASEGATIGVDLTIDEALPAGVGPNHSVDGTVQLSRLEDVLYVESPVFAQENSSISLFVIDPPTRIARRTTVRLGLRSVQYVQVLEGLREGDQVILSDMSQYDEFDRVQLN